MNSTSCPDSYICWHTCWPCPPSFIFPPTCCWRDGPADGGKATNLYYLYMLESPMSTYSIWAGSLCLPSVSPIDTEADLSSRSHKWILRTQTQPVMGELPTRGCNFLGRLTRKADL